MRKYSYYLLILSLLIGCASSQKFLEKGQYDKAIVKSANNLRKDPNNTKELNVLMEAYTKANSYDKEQIDFLKKEDRKENYYKIYSLYSRLKRRQDVIRSIPTKDQEQFTLVNYDNQIINSKKQAVDNFYQEGLTLLNRGDKQNARTAYKDFVRVNNIYSDYKNVTRLLAESHFAGTNNVLFRIKNNSNVILPKKFDTELKKISLKGLNTLWLNYDTYQDTTINYHLSLSTGKRIRM
jgi:tetratricopeptide (TPR) repeat protein